jgi:hypothetical protein
VTQSKLLRSPSRAVNCFQVMEWNGVFIIPALLNFADLSVIAPLVHWSLHATMFYKAANDEGSSYVAKNKVAPDDPPAEPMKVAQEP